MKILCTKEEYTRMVQMCAFCALSENDRGESRCADECILYDICGGDMNYLPSTCEIKQDGGI